MSFDPATRERAKQTVIQTEKWAREKGYSVLRIVHGSKQPPPEDHNYNDAANYRVPPPEVFAWGKFGIGVVSGPQRKGPLDADLDAKEALFFGPRFLPPTPATFGRPSKPASHMLYEDPNISEYPTRKFADPLLKSSIIELRADGGNQTVMPGTIHESGEMAQWADKPFPIPAPIIADELARCCAKVAIAVLIVRHLWSEGSRNDVNLCIAGMLFYMKWPLVEAEEFIRAITDYMNDEQAKDRIANVRKTYARAERGEKVRGATALKTKVLSGPDVETVVDRILEWMGPTSSSVVMEMNENFACVLLEGKFRIVHTDVPAGEPFVFQTKDDFLDAYGPFTVAGPDGKIVSKAKLWLGSPQRRFYRKAEFLPGVTEEGEVLNLWTGWAVEPEPGPCEAWLALVWEIICGENEEIYRWLMNWLAHLFQFPLEKIHTCPVIIGVQGAGKSLMCSYLSRILGAAYLQVSKPDHIHGRFNSHLRNTLLLHADEALYPRDKKHRAVIKSLIGDEKQMHEAKGVDASLVQTSIRLLLTSNYDHAAPAEEGDRRFTVIKMLGRRVDDDLKKRVVAELKSSGPAALLHYLTTQWTVDHDEVNRNLKNADWAANVLEQADPQIGWWFDKLQAGVLVPEYLRWATKPVSWAWPERVGTVALYRLFVEDMRIAGRAQGLPSPITFSTKLNELTGGVRKRHMNHFVPPIGEEVGPMPAWISSIPGSQKTILDLPDLETCRRAFDFFIGRDMEWEDPTIEDVAEVDRDKPDGQPEY